MIPSGEKLKILHVLVNAGRPLSPAEVLDWDKEISDVSVYVSLARMKVDGWIDALEPDNEGQRGRPPRRYKINATGRRVYKLARELEAERANGVIV